MPIEIVTTSCDPTNPIAGETFVLNIELNSPAPKDLTVVLEKQRVVGNVGGTPELRPTGPNYFDLFPGPIKLSAGSKTGTSGPISVRRDAAAESGDPPVRFPEQILFSASSKQLSNGFTSVVVRVSLPETN
jgi:hypothetical protein